MNYDKILSGKNVIVTGARRGIGYQIVRVFAENGANIWACVRKSDESFISEIFSLSQAHNIWIRPIFCEMTDSTQVKEAVSLIRKDKEKIDVLINNAGTTYDALLPMLSLEKARELFEVNFFSAVQFTQLVSRIMMKQMSGCIINISSYLAENGNRGQSMYSASKAAINAFTRSLAKELAEYGIRVNAVAPGIVNTDLIRTMSTENFMETVKLSAMKRPAESYEIANVIAMLSSNMCSYVNGQIIRIDGCM